MKILFAAGHVNGAKIWMGYNEDENMLDLARREARYAAERYGQTTTVFKVTNTSYNAVQAACTGYDLAVFEHSNAEASPVKGTANRVTIYRTVKNPGDGVCLKLAQVTAPVLKTVAYPVEHRKNTAGNDWYGVLKRAMLAGCSDAWLAENGFHTHPATREMLLDPMVRQRIAEVKIDTMAQYYKWEDTDVIYIKHGDGRETDTSSSPAVKGVQESILKLGFKMINNGKEFPADGRYGDATANGFAAFKTANGLTGDGQTFDSAALTVLIAQINALETDQSELDAAKALIASLQAINADAQTEITGLNEVILEKQIEIVDLKEDQADLNALKSAWKTIKEISDPP